MTEASIESDGIDVFVVYNGTRSPSVVIRTPRKLAWVSLEAGVLDKDYPVKLVAGRDGKIISD
jgi:hypothetical protein